MLNQDFFAALKRGKLKLNGTELRVYGSLVDSSTVGNMVTLTQTVLAKECGLKPTHYSHALQAIFEKDLAVRCPEPGKYHHIMVSPFWHWKGDADKHQWAMDKYRRWADKK